jgi:hypothetical protein
MRRIIISVLFLSIIFGCGNVNPVAVEPVIVQPIDTAKHSVKVLDSVMLCAPDHGYELMGLTEYNFSYFYFTIYEWPYYSSRTLNNRFPTALNPDSILILVKDSTWLYCQWGQVSHTKEYVQYDYVNKDSVFVTKNVLRWKP